MRFATLLTATLCLAPLAAQSGFSKEQRSELREIIRSEIRAAISELHGEQAKASPASGIGGRVMDDFGKDVRRAVVRTIENEPRKVQRIRRPVAPNELKANEVFEIVTSPREIGVEVGEPHVVELHDVTEGKGHALHVRPEINVDEQGRITLRVNDEIIEVPHGTLGECPAIECEIEVIGVDAKSIPTRKAQTRKAQQHIIKIGDEIIELGECPAMQENAEFFFDTRGDNKRGVFQIRTKTDGKKKGAKNSKGVLFFSDKSHAEVFEMTDATNGIEQEIKAHLTLVPTLVEKDGVITLHLGKGGENAQILIECCEGGECAECEEECEACEEAGAEVEVKAEAPRIRVRSTNKKTNKGAAKEAVVRTIDRVLKKIR